MKLYLILLSILITTLSSQAQEEINFKYTWGDQFELEESLQGLSEIIPYQNQLYINYMSINEGVFYPDIKRSREQATFFKLNEEKLALEESNEISLNYELFHLSDFRTKYNSVPFDQKFIYDPYKRYTKPEIKTDTIALFTEFENKLYSDTILVTSSNKEFEVSTRGFISDKEKMKGVILL